MFRHNWLAYAVRIGRVPVFLFGCFLLSMAALLVHAPGVDSTKAQEPPTSEKSNGNHVGQDELLPVLWIEHEPFEDNGFKGVELVIWNDGYLLYSLNPSRRDTPFMVTKISPKFVNQTVTAIIRSGFCDIQSTSHLVPHSSFLKFAVRDATAITVHQWDEVVRPGWGPNIRPTESFIKFAQVWIASRIRANACLGQVTQRPKEIVEKFRGIDPAKPIVPKEWTEH